MEMLRLDFINMRKLLEYFSWVKKRTYKFFSNPEKNLKDVSGDNKAIPLPNKKAENYAKGIELYKAGKYDEALQMFGIEVRADSTDAEIIGQIMGVMGQQTIKQRRRRDSRL